MKIRSQQDFYSSLRFMAVDIAFAGGAATSISGEGARVGPGYFPLVLGVLILGEPFTAWIAAGTVLVIAGIYVLTRATGLKLYCVRVPLA